MKLKPSTKAKVYIRKENSKEFVSRKHQKKIRGREIREPKGGVGTEETKSSEIVKPQGLSEKHHINTDAYLTAATCFKINY